MDLSSSDIKKFLYSLKYKNHLFYIFSKERFSYISRNETLNFSAQVQRIKKSTPRKFLILQERETSQKILIFSQKKALLFFRKQKPWSGNSKNLLIFQEVTWKAQKTIKKVCAEESSCLLWRFCNVYISRAHRNSP